MTASVVMDKNGDYNIMTFEVLVGMMMENVAMSTTTTTMAMIMIMMLVLITTKLTSS